MHEQSDAPAKSSGELRYPFRALPEPGQMIEVAPVFSLLFRRPVSEAILQMATGESVAHLNCLIHRGLAEVEMDDAGVSWYRAI
jgi:hypothetical protein